MIFLIVSEEGLRGSVRLEAPFLCMPLIVTLHFQPLSNQDHVWALACVRPANTFKSGQTKDKVYVGINRVFTWLLTSKNVKDFLLCTRLLLSFPFFFFGMETRHEMVIRQLRIDESITNVQTAVRMPKSRLLRRSL